MQLKKFIETTCNKPISECSNQELYLALLSYTKEQIKEMLEDYTLIKKES